MEMLANVLTALTHTHSLLYAFTLYAQFCIYRETHKKSSGDVVSAVCYTTYIHYLSIPLNKNS